MIHKTKKLINTLRLHLPKLAIALDVLSELLEVATPKPKATPKLERKRTNRNHRLQ